MKDKEEIDRHLHSVTKPETNPVEGQVSNKLWSLASKICLFFLEKNTSKADLFR